MLSRQILKSKKQEETKVFAIVEMMFTVVFLINRLFLGTIVVYNAWVSTIKVIIKTNMSIVHGVGVFWSYVIVSMVAKKFKNINNPIVKFINSILWLIKRNKPGFILFIAIFSFIYPYFRAAILKAGFLNITYKGFIIL